MLFGSIYLGPNPSPRTKDKILLYISMRLYTILFENLKPEHQAVFDQLKADHEKVKKGISTEREKLKILFDEFESTRFPTLSPELQQQYTTQKNKNLEAYKQQDQEMQQLYNDIVVRENEAIAAAKAQEEKLQQVLRNLDSNKTQEIQSKLDVELAQIAELNAELQKAQQIKANSRRQKISPLELELFDRLIKPIENEIDQVSKEIDQLMTSDPNNFNKIKDVLKNKFRVAVKKTGPAIMALWKELQVNGTTPSIGIMDVIIKHLESRQNLAQTSVNSLQQLLKTAATKSL